MDRINEILEFFQKEGIVENAVDVTFYDDEDTEFDLWEMRININDKEIMENGFINAEELTCGNDIFLLDKFTRFEICFFHELGHYCDLAYRFDFNPQTMYHEMDILEPYNQTMMDAWEKFQRIMGYNEGYQEAMKFYRAVGVEKVADENARDLMKYYLENCK